MKQIQTAFQSLRQNEILMKIQMERRFRCVVEPSYLRKNKNFHGNKNVDFPLSELK